MVLDDKYEGGYDEPVIVTASGDHHVDASGDADELPRVGTVHDIGDGLCFTVCCHLHFTQQWRSKALRGPGSAVRVPRPPGKCWIFFLKIPEPGKSWKKSLWFWKVLEIKAEGPGKSWKISLKVMHFIVVQIKNKQQ